MDQSAVQSRSGESAHGWIWGTLIAGALIFCYAPVFAGMAHQWWNISFYSYAFLIPLISAYLIWTRRHVMYSVPIQPGYLSGTVCLAAGLVLFMIGQAGGIVALQQISLMITLPGLLLFLFGRKFLFVLALPLAFLWFMIPIWDAVTEPLHFPFQNFSADLGVQFLRTVGIPVYQDGVLIHLPNITLEVAKSCSGVNYLIAVLATSIPLATLVLSDVKKRVVLVAFAVIVSALANSLRVALIGFLAYYELSGDLHGPYHTLHGLFVSMVGYVAIFAGLWFLSSDQSRKERSVPADKVEAKWNALPVSQSKIAWSFLIVLFLSVGASRYIDRAQAMPLRQDLSALPIAMSKWFGTDAAFMEPPPGVDRTLSRVYRTEMGEQLELAVWYFESQVQGKELVNPVTARLHDHARTVSMTTGSETTAYLNESIRANRGEKRHLIYFWYVINGRVIASHYAAKLYTAWDAMVHGRTAGALIYVSTEIDSDDLGSRERASALLQEFIRGFYPLLHQYFSNPT